MTTRSGLTGWRWALRNGTLLLVTHAALATGVAATLWRGAIQR